MPRPRSAGRVTVQGEAPRQRTRPTDRITRTRRLKHRRQSPIGLSLERVEDLELLDAAEEKAEDLITEALLDADEEEPADGETADPQQVERPLRDRRRELDTYTRRKRLDGRSTPAFPERNAVQVQAQSRRPPRPRTATAQRRHRPASALMQRSPERLTRPASAQAKGPVGWVRPQRYHEEELGIVEDTSGDGFEEAIHAWTGNKRATGGVVALTATRPAAHVKHLPRVAKLVNELRALLLAKRHSRSIAQLFRLFDRRVRRKVDGRDLYEGLCALGIPATLGDAQALLKVLGRAKELRCADLAVFLDDPDFERLERAVCAGAAQRLLPPPPPSAMRCEPLATAINTLRDAFGDCFITRRAFAEGLRQLQLDRVAPDVVHRLTTAYDLNGDGRVHAFALVKAITRSKAWKDASKARRRVLQISQEADQAYETVDDTGFWPPGLDEELVECCRALGLRCLSDDNALWVAQRALRSELPPNWVRSHSEDGRPFFHDLLTNTSTWDRPFSSEFVRLARDAARRRRRVIIEESDDDDALVVDDDDDEELEVERVAARSKSANVLRRRRVGAPEADEEVTRSGRPPRPASAPPRRLMASPTPFLSPVKSASDEDEDEDDAVIDEDDAAIDDDDGALTLSDAHDASAQDAAEPEPTPPSTPPARARTRAGEAVVTSPTATPQPRPRSAGATRSKTSRPSTKVARVLADLQARVRLLEKTTGRQAPEPWTSDTGRRAPEPWTPDGIRGVSQRARTPQSRTPARMPSRTGPRARRTPLPGGHTGPRPRSAGPRSASEMSRPPNGGVVVFIT